MEPIRKKYTREVPVVRGSGTFCTHKGGFILGCDSDATELQCRFQHRYPIAATTQVIADHRQRTFSSQGSSPAVAAELNFF